MTPAEDLARKAHATQVDKAGEPYIGHVERVVANLIQRWPDATEDEIAAAWLHDIIEDAGWDEDMLLKAGISENAVSIVKELTHPPGGRWPYLSWIASLAHRGSLSCVKVKLADIQDNSSPARVSAIPEGPELFKTKYLPAAIMLEARIRAEVDGTYAENPDRLRMIW